MRTPRPMLLLLVWLVAIHSVFAFDEDSSFTVSYPSRDFAKIPEAVAAGKGERIRGLPGGCSTRCQKGHPRSRAAVLYRFKDAVGRGRWRVTELGDAPDATHLGGLRFCRGSCWPTCRNSKGRFQQLQNAAAGQAFRHPLSPYRRHRRPRLAQAMRSNRRCSQPLAAPMPRFLL